MIAVMPKRQRGVALITVVLIVSIVTVLAASMAAQQNMDIRRSGNVLSLDQLDQFARGAEQLAMYGLLQDFKNTDFDGPDEEWTFPQSYEADDSSGTISGQLVDLNRYINVNNLLDENGTPSQVHIDRMRRLFNLKSVDDSLVDALVDWLDANDSDIYGFGAEDNEYLLLEIPYRTADAEMASISELSLVKGFNREVLAKLVDDEDRPLLTAIPRGSLLNVNTASAEIIAATFDIELNDVAGLVGGEIGELEKLDELLNDPVVHAKNSGGPSGGNNGGTGNSNGSWFTDPIKPTLAVKSDYFLLNGVVSYAERELTMYSVLKRDSDGKSEVIYRSQGVY